MDNLTHSVIGFVAGAAAAQVAAATRSARAGAGLASGVRQPAFIALGIIGGNLPDADLLVSYSDGRLGYLLQHRGYTHTLLGCFALALLAFVAVVGWLRVRRHALCRADLRDLGAMSLLAVLLHLGMDSLNSYGVHPFWPWDNTWRYGDAVFIVEPWYWIAAAPLLFAVRSIAWRVVLGVVLLAALAANVALHPALPLWWLGVLGLLVLLVALGRRGGPRVAAGTSVALLLAVTLTFTLASRDARATIEALARASFPGETLIDHVLSPSPTTPFCWDVLLLQADRHNYIVRRGMLATGPQSRPADCPLVFRRQDTSAPWGPAAASGSDRLQWFGEFALPLELLPALVRGNCATEALMQFVRAPFAVRVQEQWLIGDLRFDREPGAGFAELEAGAGDAGRCPRAVPWVPPRADLLRPP